MTEVTISSILTDVTAVFTEAIEWAGTVGTTIVNTPLLMVFVSVPLIGLGIGIFRRLINVN